MNGDQTGSILINIVDGTRKPLPGAVKWSGRVHDSRPPDQWQLLNFDGAGSAVVVKELRWFNNLFDDYTVIVNAKGYEDAGWMPVRISPARPGTVDLMLMQKGADLNFGGADWKALNSLRPRFAQIISAGIGDAASRYSNLIEQSEGLLLACLLNLLTAMSQITLPSEKSPLDYYWQSASRVYHVEGVNAL